MNWFYWVANQILVGVIIPHMFTRCHVIMDNLVNGLKWRFNSKHQEPILLLHSSQVIWLIPKVVLELYSIFECDIQIKCCSIINTLLGQTHFLIQNWPKQKWAYNIFCLQLNVQKFRKHKKLTKLMKYIFYQSMDLFGPLMLCGLIRGPIIFWF